MEGLIPVVYKSLKRSKIRRRYECLSSGAAQPDFSTRDFDDHDHDPDHDHDYLSRKTESGARHRRCNSVRADRTGGFASMDDAYKPKQLVRFRSHRMLSCLSAA